MLQIPRCTVCNGVIPLDAEACPVCHPPPPAPLRLEARQEKYPAPSLATFSIGSLLLMITLIGIGLGAFSVSPLLGLIVLLLFPPAMVRSVLHARYHKQRYGTLEIYDKVLIFVYSLLAIVVMGIAMFISFGVTLSLGYWLGDKCAVFAMPYLKSFYFGRMLMGLSGLLTGTIGAIVCGYVMWRWVFPIRSP